MDINWLEWMGYAASAIILVSLLMSSVKKLRIINLFGSVIFAIYGFLIESIPVAVMNIGIVLINVYYLYQMYGQQEFFKILDVKKGSKYLKNFLEFYSTDIEAFGGFDKSKLDSSVIRFFVLRNMVVAGVFICSQYKKDTLKIELDFATPQYRDLKIGRFIFEKQKELFLNKGYTKLISKSDTQSHIKYLKKMGFKGAKNREGYWMLKLKK